MSSSVTLSVSAVCGSDTRGRGQPVLRICSFVVGCMAVGISYMVNAFNIYALALKSTFGLSQTKLELLCSMLFLGLVASLPGGWILDKLGARWAALVAGVVSVCGYVLIWWASLHPTAYSFPTTVLFFLLAGVGGGLTYIAGTAANVRNFSEHMRGTVVGVIHAALSAGPAVIMLVYNSFFAGNNPSDPSTHDLPGFFTFVAITFGLINLLGVLLYGHYPTDEEQKPLLDNVYNNEGSETSPRLRVSPPHRFANNYDAHLAASSAESLAVHSHEDQISERGVNEFVEHTCAQSSTEPTHIYELSSNVAQPADEYFTDGTGVASQPAAQMLTHSGSYGASLPHSPVHFSTEQALSRSLARSLVRAQSKSRRNTANLELDFSHEATRSLARSLVVSQRASNSVSSVNDIYNTSVGPLVASKKLVLESQLEQLVQTGSGGKCEGVQMFTMDFQLLLWPCVILLAPQMMFIQNLTSLLESVEQEQYIYLFPYITPILGTFAKPIIGLASDACIRRVPRAIFIIIGSALGVLVWLLSIFFIDDISLILISTTICDLAAYTAYSLGPPLLIERFGMASFSRNWSLVMAMFAVSTSVLLAVFGAVYDANTSPDTALCYGLVCFADTFILSTVLSILAVISAVAFHLRHRTDLRVIED